jgi:hypothetical protein
MSGRVRRPNRRQIGVICPQRSGEVTNAAAEENGGVRARITIADVTPGNNLAIESGGSQLAHRTALLCPGRQQTLKRTH